jgi:hypothetical protein
MAMDRDAVLRELAGQIDDLEKRLRANDQENDWSELADDTTDSDDEDDDSDSDSDDSDDESDDNTKRGRAPDLAKATKFQSMVDLTAREQGVSKTEAARRVRQEYPDIAHGYDDLTSKSYNSLVQAEIAKGCSPVVAAQRVCHLYPDAAQSAISKSADSDAARFMKVVIDIMQRDRCSRTEAMTKARREDPARFAKYQKQNL